MCSLKKYMGKIIVVLNSNSTTSVIGTSIIVTVLNMKITNIKKLFYKIQNN